MLIILNQSRCELKKKLAGEASFHPSLFARRHLRWFKGARLAVFLSLLLHSNEEGWAQADIRQLERETGYKKQAVENAVSGLCKLEVDGQRVLLGVPERKKGGVVCHVHFLLFPTAGDIARYGS